MTSAILVGLVLAAQAAGQIEFEDVTSQAGLRRPLQGMMGHGAAWGDVDGDGRPELYVGGFADRPDQEYAPAAGPVGNLLLRNLGNGRFERDPQPAVEFYARTSGAVFADLDNDGDLELYVANNCKGKTKHQSGPQRQAQLRRSTLLRNDAGKLVDISQASGACPDSLGTARNIGVFDYNSDGLLDLLVIEDKFTRDPRSILLKNLGGLKFEDAGAAAGLPDDLFGLGLAVADVNADGRPDFFVGHSNRMFLSGNDGRYREDRRLNQTLAMKPLDGEDWPCGAAFADLNRDGRLDLVVGVHFQKARNRVYLNEGVQRGVPRFRDVTAQVGLDDAWANKCPHVEVQDFDNDGLPDLYFSAAWLDKDGSITPLIYRQVGVQSGLPRFEKIRALRDGDRIVYFPAGPSADYNADGRVDLALVNWFAGNHCRLLKNIGGGKNHWLDVRVTGREFNRMGVGSQITVYPAGKLGQADALLGFQEVTIGYGYASGQEAVCHFGLGRIDRVDLQVRLPDGRSLQRHGVPADQTLLVEAD